MSLFRPHYLLLFWLFLAFSAGCGSQGDIFGGQDNLPIAGVSPWEKIDFYSDFELAQPFILVSDENMEFIEPCLIEIKDQLWMYFEALGFSDENGIQSHQSSAIYLAKINNDGSWEIVNQGEPVIVADESWEGDYVGAPTVIFHDHQFVAYYSGNRGAGIGRAVSKDGIVWEKQSNTPVLVPDQKWEGGEFGQILSPSVVVNDDVYLLWYSGGLAGYEILDRLMGRAIGYAQSEDGISFIKMDTQGRTSITHPGIVEPIFTAEKAWEGHEPDTNEIGKVGMPGVFADRRSDRTVFRMYYSGHKIGDIFSDNVSIGYAGSFDGINFERAKDLLNPILTETFVLTVDGVSDLFDFDEFAGSVIMINNDEFLMAFSQIDAMNWLGYSLKGIGLASCPPRH